MPLWPDLGYLFFCRREQLSSPEAEDSTLQKSRRESSFPPLRFSPASFLGYFAVKTREAESAKFSGSYIDSTLAGGAVAWPATVQRAR